MDDSEVQFGGTAATNEGKQRYLSLVIGESNNENNPYDSIWMRYFQ